MFNRIATATKLDIMNIVGENDQNSLVQGRQINDIFSPVIFVPGVWGQRHVDT